MAPINPYESPLHGGGFATPTRRTWVGDVLTVVALFLLLITAGFFLLALAASVWAANAPTGSANPDSHWLAFATWFHGVGFLVSVAAIAGTLAWRLFSGNSRK
jgi:hypothetical protein